jgi:peptide chain release factor 3
MIGVVGALQFDVIASRLKNEYGVAAEIEPQVYTAARWLGNVGGPPPLLGGACVMAADSQGRRVILFGSEWELRYFERHHPDVVLFEESPALQSK